MSSVAAAPMKWLLVDSPVPAVEGQAASAVRVGLYMPSKPDFPLPEGHPPVALHSQPQLSHFKHRPGCKGMMKTKMIELSNKLRATLGLPLIESTPPSSHIETWVSSHRVWHKGSPHHKHHRIQHLHKDAPFIARLTHALNDLGKWEGRAVAFVIGGF